MLVIYVYQHYYSHVGLICLDSWSRILFSYTRFDMLVLVACSFEKFAEGRFVFTKKRNEGRMMWERGSVVIFARVLY